MIHFASSAFKDNSVKSADVLLELALLFGTILNLQTLPPFSFIVNVVFLMLRKKEHIVLEFKL